MCQKNKLFIIHLKMCEWVNCIICCEPYLLKCHDCQVDKPSAGAGQVLVRVKACGLSLVPQKVSEALNSRDKTYFLFNGSNLKSFSTLGYFHHILYIYFPVFFQWWELLIIYKPLCTMHLFCYKLIVT